MEISPFFAAEKLLQEITYKKVKVEINNPEGGTIFAGDAEVPEFWSEVAATILASKYFRKRGLAAEYGKIEEDGVPSWLWRSVPKIFNSDYSIAQHHLGETSAKQVFHRLAGCWTYYGWKYGYFSTEQDAHNFYSNTIYCLAHQIAAPNSPQFFNTGLYWAYGIGQESEDVVGYHISGLDKDLRINDSELHCEVHNPYEYPTTSACFINGVRDDLVGDDGIMDLWKTEAAIFKYGSGSGVNVSNIRGRGEPLSGGGTSSGLMSFLKIGDTAAGSIKSGGVTRRAALLRLLDDDHPDLLEFIDWKVQEERKVAALVAGSQICLTHLQKIYNLSLAETTEEKCDPGILVKAINKARQDFIPENLIQQTLEQAQQKIPFNFKTFDIDWQSEAYQTVSGQNSNNSIRVSDKFMQAVEDEQDWGLKARTTGDVMKTLPAQELWSKISQAAWSSADPGLHFSDTINSWHTCSNSEEIKASNPCFVGKTLVDTSEGKIPISILESMYRCGKTLPLAFSFSRKEQMPVLRQIRKVWIAKKTRNLVKIITDKGIEITCTPDHPFLIRCCNKSNDKGCYVKAANLIPGQSLRKISRSIDKNTNRCSIYVKISKHGSGCKLQSRFIWEEVFGPLPEGYHVHHKNGDPTDDRLSNFELIERTEHHIHHSTGERNPRYLETDPRLLIEIWDKLESKRNKKTGKCWPVTQGRWNIYIHKNNLKGKIPLANIHGIQGKSWKEFTHWINENRGLVNHKIISVERFRTKKSVPVYDMEVADTHNFGVTSDIGYEAESIIVSNCSEYQFINSTACNLASLNLIKFLNPATSLTSISFDFSFFEKVVTLWTIILEISVAMAKFPTKEIAKRSWQFRTLGLGFANLGGLLMTCGYPYDSRAGRDFAARIASTLTAQGYITSAKMAEELGSFSEWEKNKEPMLAVIKKHWQAADTLDDDYQSSLWHEAYVRGSDFGFRNAQISVCAPTGCLVAGSLIQTNKGLKRIEHLGDIKGEQWQDVNFKVMTDKGLKRATKFYVNGLSEVKNIRTKHGYEINGTPKHKIKVVDKYGKWRWMSFAKASLNKRRWLPIMLNTIFGEPNEIKLPFLGTEYRSNRGRGLFSPGLMNQELAELVGIYMAEGSFHSKGLRFSLTAEDDDLAARVEDLCSSLFGLETHLEYDSRGRSVSINASSMQIARWWEECGFTKHKIEGKSGKGSFIVHIPNSILDSNEEEIYCAFLRGLFSGDGSTSSGLPIITMKDFSFAQEVRTLLAVVGIVTTSDLNYRADSYSKESPYINRIRIFNKRYTKIWERKIGFTYCRRKAEKVNSNTSKCERYDFIPVKLELIKSLDLPMKFKNSLLRKYALNRCLSRRDVEKCYNLTGNIRLSYLLRFFYDFLAETKDVDSAPTYDISVPSNLTYTANGFISHNTIGLLMDCDTTGIEPDFSLIKHKKLAGGGYLKLVNQAVPNALAQLNYSPEQITKILKYLTTQETIEGAPELREEHLEVFDCAVQGTGKRSISVMGHMQMMADIQPFISGALSKTVNIPYETTVKEISDFYFLAWKLGIKAIALYRDGSKLSQPLSSSKLVTSPQVKDERDVILFQPYQRQKLPDKRRGKIQKANVGGTNVYLHTGEYDDGRLGEIFINLAKQGTAFSALMDAFAQAISIALQYQVPLQEFVDAFVEYRFEPAGLVRGHEKIKMSSSVLDYIFRSLAFEYLYSPELQEKTEKTEKVLSFPKKKSTGDVCSCCGNFSLTRSGSCFTCTTCGETTGCG